MAWKGNGRSKAGSGASRDRAVRRPARLSSQADYTVFSFGDTSLKFAAPYSLRRYVRVKKWHDGYLEVEADYGHGIEEDYIDLKPVLRNLLINPRTFLKPIENVEVCYA